MTDEEIAHLKAINASRAAAMGTAMTFEQDAETLRNVLLDAMRYRARRKWDVAHGGPYSCDEAFDVLSDRMIAGQALAAEKHMDQKWSQQLSDEDYEALERVLLDAKRMRALRDFMPDWPDRDEPVDCQTYADQLLAEKDKVIAAQDSQDSKERE
jgi:hypothetical protein